MTVSELTEKLAAQGARLGEYRGGQTAAVYTDVKAEFGALRAGAGVYDLGWRAKILLTGADRVRWLNGMITNNVRDLSVGHGVYAFLLNPQGHILADLYAYNRGDSIVIDSDQSQAAKIQQTFDHYIIMDDVEVSDAGEKLTAIGVAGPKVRETLRNAGLDVPELKALEFQDTTWNGMGVTVVRNDRETTEAYEIWLGPGNVNPLWEALVKAGASPVGFEALELWRIAEGVPRYGQDIRERDLPQETEQARALHFSKGCYVGQEIVERIRSRGSVHRKFTGLRIEGPLPAAGTKLQLDGKDIGEITSSASLPLDDGSVHVGLGYVRREAAIPGKQLEWGSAKATVSDLPFAEFGRRN